MCICSRSFPQWYLEGQKGKGRDLQTQLVLTLWPCSPRSWGTHSTCVNTWWRLLWLLPVLPLHFWNYHLLSWQDIHMVLFNVFLFVYILTLNYASLMICLSPIRLHPERKWLHPGSVVTMTRGSPKLPGWWFQESVIKCVCFLVKDSLVIIL